MSIDQAHHIAEMLAHATVITLRSSIICLALLVIGAPVSIAFGGKMTAPFAMTCGLFVLTVASWYAFKLGATVDPVYVALLVIGLAASWKSAAKLAAFSVAAFIIPAFICSALSVVKLHSGTLPLLSTGNNDLFAYLKIGNLLAELPNVQTMLAGADSTPSLTLDVFGAYSLISLASFILHIGVERCAAPVFSFAVGFLALGIAMIGRRIFALPHWLAIAFAMVLTTGPLFTYLILNYFLSQVLFEGILLATIYHVAEIPGGHAGGTRRAAFALMIGAACVMFTYHPWFVQYMALAAVCVAIALLLNNRGAAIAMAASAIIFLAINAFDLLIGMGRYISSVKAFISAAGNGVAGWPLPFVDLNLLIGMPGHWPPSESNHLLATIPAVLVLVVASAIGWRDKDVGNGPRRLVLLCSIGAMVLYLIAWKVYGESYRQWKFATTLPLPLGFVAAAYISFAVLRAHNGLIKMFRFAFAVVALLIIAWNVNYFYRASAPAIHLDADLSKIAVADTDDSVKAAYIDISGFSQRMAAAIFVNQKPLFFGGETYYGPATKPENLPAGTIAVLRETCMSREGSPDYEIVKVAASEITSSKDHIPLNVSFGLDNRCLKISGFSGQEAWGRWTDGKSASISLQCNCDLSKQKAHMTLNAGTFLVPGRVDRQRAIFHVNESPPQERVLDAMDKKDITIDIPPADGNPSRIDVKIELPDAASPPAGDPRLLGLSVSSISLSAS